MESQEVIMNGGFSNGVVDVLDGVMPEQLNLVQVVGDEVIADGVLEDLDEYFYDINDRLMISRMVSDAVTKGMVMAVQQELAETVAIKELEVADLKESLQSRKLVISEYEDFPLPVVQREHQVGNDSWLSLADGCVSHEKMRDDLHHLKISMRERFNKAEKEIEYVRGSIPIEKIDSGSDLVGLGGILLEKHSVSLAHVNETLECLKRTMDSFCTKVDDMLLSSKVSLYECQQEFELLAELENTVMHSLLSSFQEEFAGNLLQHNVLVSEDEYVNWLEKYNDISCISSQLDLVLKALSIPETGLVSYGSSVVDPLNHNPFRNHISPPPSLPGDDGILAATNIHEAESYDFQQLKHLKGEELVDYFKSVITKMSREYESVIHQKTEECFRLKRDNLKLKATRKDEELDLLRKTIPHVILKLEDFLYGNQYFPALKKMPGSILCENPQLRDCLSEKEIQIKCLQAHVSDAAVAANIEAADIESLIVQGLDGLILTEVAKDALEKFSNLNKKVLLDREVIINLETKAIEKENNLQLEVEEKKKLKHELFDLRTAMDQKEKRVVDLSSSLSKQAEELCTVLHELTQQRTLVTESNRELQLLRSKHLEVSKQIEANKIDIDRLELELDQTRKVLTKACKERNEAFTLAQERNDMLLWRDAQEKEVKEVLQMAANGFMAMFDGFALRLSSEIKRNISRLQDADCHLRPLKQRANVFRRTELLYRQRCTDLRLAEEEVDLLGDQVDALLPLLEKIYIALDHYAPVLKHYSGIMEILQLIRRELSGESRRELSRESVKLH